MRHVSRLLVILVVLGFVLFGLVACAAPAAPTAAPSGQQPTAAPAATKAPQPAAGGKQTLVVAGRADYGRGSKGVARPSRLHRCRDRSPDQRWDHKMLASCAEGTIPPLILSALEPDLNGLCPTKF